MIPKRHRGIPSRLIARIMKQGRRISLPEGTIFWQNSDPDTPSRLAVIISKKTAKTAVIRNKIRRSFSSPLYSEHIKGTSGRDIVILLRSGHATPSHTFMETIETIFSLR